MRDSRSSSFIARKNGPFRVIASLITLVSFFFNMAGGDYVACAARTPLELTRVGPDRAGSTGILKELNVDTFTLPEYLGHVKDSYNSQTPNSKLVIHIQDAHSNYAAQHKINEILEYLNREYGVNTINLEGGAKDYDFSIFTHIADRALREKVADNFVKEGLVNGAEYFAINNPDKADLWGVEDVKLYVENLNVYRESLKHKEEVENQLKALNHILSNLKRHIYSESLFELDMKYTAYKAGNLEFKEYLTYLIGKAKQEAVDIKIYKNIFLLQQALLQEGEIDFKKANSERDGLIDRLQKKLSKNDMEELVLKTLEVKSERISQREFYTYIAKKAKTSNIGLETYPELQRYIVYIAIYAAIDKSKVIEEVDILENTIKAALCQNEAQRELIKLSKNLALLKSIFNISLTKEDYKYYRDNKASFDIKNYISFIAKNAPLYKITASLDKDAEWVDQYRDNITRFYECSLKRDEAFIKNMKFSVPTVIVTGGFHTENLCELFKKNNISYVSLMPNFKNGDGYESPYFRLLAGEVTGIQKRIYSVFSTAAPVSTIQIASLFSPLLSKEVWGKDAVTLDDIWVWMEEQRIAGTNIRVVSADNKELMTFAKEGMITEMKIDAVRQAVVAAKTAVLTKQLAELRATSGTSTRSLDAFGIIGPITEDTIPAIYESLYHPYNPRATLITDPGQWEALLNVARTAESERNKKFALDSMEIFMNREPKKYNTPENRAIVTDLLREVGGRLSASGEVPQAVRDGLHILANIVAADAVRISLDKKTDLSLDENKNGLSDLIKERIAGIMADYKDNMYIPTVLGPLWTPEFQDSLTEENIEGYVASLTRYFRTNLTLNNLINRPQRIDANGLVESGFSGDIVQLYVGLQYKPITDTRLSASGMAKVTINDMGQTVLNAGLLEAISRGENNWDGWIDSMKGADREIANMIGHDLFNGEATMINIGISEVGAGAVFAQYQQYATQPLKEARDLVVRLDLGNITINLYRETPEGKRALMKQIEASGIDKKQSRIVTFSYQTEDAKIRDTTLEENSYVVYMTGKAGETVTPVGTACMAGLEYLNHSDLNERPEKDISMINTSIERFARALAVMGSLSIDDILNDIAKKDENGLMSLIASGMILVKIRPINTQEIVDFHKAESEVLRAL